MFFLVEWLTPPECKFKQPSTSKNRADIAICLGLCLCLSGAQLTSTNVERRPCAMNKLGVTTPKTWHQLIQSRSDALRFSNFWRYWFYATSGYNRRGLLYNVCWFLRYYLSLIGESLEVKSICIHSPSYAGRCQLLKISKSISIYHLGGYNDAIWFFFLHYW